MDLETHESHTLEREEDQDAMDTSIDNLIQSHERTGIQQADPPLDSALFVSQNSEIIQEPPTKGERPPAQLEQNAHAPSKSYLTQDLLSVFGLQPLVASVARTDPATGQKINKMRKSYEGKVKAFQLPGRNRAVKHEVPKDENGIPKEGRLLGLLELATWPEEEWYNTKVMGKEFHKGLSSATLGKLEKAMYMLPGPIPNKNEWDDLLGFEKAKPDQSSKKPSHPENFKRQSPLETIKKSNHLDSSMSKANGAAGYANALKKPGQPANTTIRVNGLTNGAHVDTGTTSPSDRPKRSGKKRRYDDLSFDGYGDGFLDDDVGEGYTSGEGSRKSTTSKRRKKDYGSTNSTGGLDDRRVNYGMSIGVGGGIGAYGR